jgi:hypothetical protein
MRIVQGQQKYSGGLRVVCGPHLGVVCARGFYFQKNNKFKMLSNKVDLSKRKSEITFPIFALISSYQHFLRKEHVINNFSLSYNKYKVPSDQFLH